ncbi:hypothetical protein [Paenibacillus sp. FSL H3-0333]|uniref:hypothetical protein n=1 Tax=Paenibacillus sp. FSL H3-0333 TaxID=2921373 RepID=UPI0030FA20C7
MNIKHVVKIYDYPASTGDVIITSDMNGTDHYLMFCSSEASSATDPGGYSVFYFTDLKSGDIIEQQIHEDDEIEIGTEINGCGAVTKIIPNRNIEVLLHETE